MSVSVTHIDQRLDDLERLRGDMAPEAFLFTLISTLSDVLGASNVSLVHPINEQLFVSVASTQSTQTEPDRQWLASQLPAARAAESNDSNLAVSESRWIDSRSSDSTDDAYRLACSLAPTTWRYGGLIIAWQSQVGVAEGPTIRGVVEAFAELAYSHYLETLAGDHESRSRALIVLQGQLLETKDDDRASAVLVNALSSLLPADRVCLLSSVVAEKPKLLVVSGADDFDRRTDAVKQIELAATETSKTRQPQFALQLEESPIESDSGSTADSDRRGCICFSIPWDDEHVLLIQWMSEPRFASAVPRLQLSCQTLQSTWRQTLAWNRVPKLLRHRWQREPERSASKQVINLITAIVVVGLITALALFPIPFSVSGVGTLEPIQQRWIFASQDGFVRKLHVTAGQQVVAGDAIATLESSDLEIQITEVAGRIREVETQRQSIEVTINQLVRSTAPDPALENRLQSELKELAIRLESLNAQAEILDAQRSALQVVSPIDGTIVGWEVERNLLGRPVRRGDVLLRVADKDAAWRIEFMVPDRDAGYLERFADDVAPESVTAQYALRSDPQQKYQGEMNWMSPEVVHDPLQGAVVETHLSVDQDALSKTALGATVDGRLSCGSKPRWFVWGRPILEAIQRRLWF